MNIDSGRQKIYLQHCGVFFVVSVFSFFATLHFFGWNANHRAEAATGSVSLVIAGDWDDDFPGSTQNTLQNAMNAQADMIGFLGDLSYAGKNTDLAAAVATSKAWCSKVRPIIGSLPTIFLVGDHDSWMQDGDVNTYDDPSCLTRPTAVSYVKNFTGTYPWLFYYDIVKDGTTVRIVGSTGGPESSVLNSYPTAKPYMQNYQKGGASYNFLAQAFTDAKNKGYWTIYLNHEPCIDAGKDYVRSWCFDVANLMAETGVDVFLSASSHNAWLTKQMNIGSGCIAITMNGNGGVNLNCAKSVVNNAYKEGEGWVNAHAGTAGKPSQSGYDCFNGPDVPYLVPGTCSGSSNADGAVHLSITDSVIQGRFKRNSGSDLYTFSMSRSNIQPTSVVSPTSSITPTNIASTPTFIPGSTRIGLTLFLHGIGLGGDNINPASTGNSAPLHQSRIVTITLLDTKGIESVRQGIVQYNSASGSFKGVIDLGNIPDDQYIIKVKSDMYLARRYNGMYALSSSQTRQMPNAFLITGDANEDNRLSIYDYNLILDCYSDTAPARNCTADKKLKTDLTDDGFVNHFDYNLFLRELSVQVGDEMPTITPQPTPTKVVTPTPTKVPTPTPTRLLTPTPTRIPPTATLVPTTGSGTYPSNILNLQNWKLTLPTGSSGSPTEIKQPTLTNYINDPWFIPVSVPEGGIVYRGVRFRAPVNGVTTSGSSYPRSELREMTNNGTANAAWSTSTGTHTMFIEQAITAIPQSKQHVVAGQVHDSGDDVIVIRLEYPKLFIDIGGSDGPTLDANYVLGKKFTVKFVVNGGKTSIYYNNSTTPAYVLSKSYSGAYFKAGAYAQANCSTESVCSANNYGEVVIYQLEVTHQ